MQDEGWPKLRRATCRGLFRYLANASLTNPATLIFFFRRLTPNQNKLGLFKLYLRSYHVCMMTLYTPLSTLLASITYGVVGRIEKNRLASH